MRVPKYPHLVEPTQSGLSDWTNATPEKKKRSNTVTPKTWEKAMFVVRTMFATGDWTRATPIHLVATFALLHRSTYGVLPGELDAVTLFRVRLHATKFFVQEFDSDWSKFVQYARWVWTREKQREEWRKRNNNDYRLGPYQFFSKKILTDWIVSQGRISTPSSNGVGA